MGEMAQAQAGAIIEMLKLFSNNYR